MIDASTNTEWPTILLIGNVETGDWAKVFAMAKPSEIAESVLKISGAKKE